MKNLVVKYIALLLLLLLTNASEETESFKKSVTFQMFVATKSSQSAPQLLTTSYLTDVMKKSIVLSKRMIACESKTTLNHTCFDDSFVDTWARNVVSSSFCEAGESSAMSCVDSRSGSRVCVFNNVMLDMRKMRTKKRKGKDHSSRNPSRSWERG